ncbi:MAG: lipid A-modifier LpxR family protein [Granulosicoccus sp.]
MQRSLRTLGLLALLMVSTNVVSATKAVDNEDYNTGWAFHIDNDLLVGGDRDQDYTGGMSLAFSGSRAARHTLSVDGTRKSLNRLSGFNRAFANTLHFTLHSMDAGFALFTPSNITETAAQHQDHPYASLFFLSNSEQIVLADRRSSYQSSFTIGLLGLPLAEDIQSALHERTGSDTPKGWKNQISEGGEPTARYTIGVLKNILHFTNQDRLGFEINLTGEADIGFTTGAHAGINIRMGRLATPWWSFSPHQAEYVNQGAATPNSPNFLRAREFFFYMGGAVKYRLYNALLQGQFRQSEVSFDRSELESIIGEVWAGVHMELPSRLRIGLFARARNSEFKAQGAREPVWGGLSISRAL